MGGDGVSLPTVLSQAGNVAKALARNQQAANTAGSSLAPQDKEELQELKKIPEAQKAQKQTTQRRLKEKRRGKRDAAHPERHAAPDEYAEDLDEAAPKKSQIEMPGLGTLIDRKA